MNNVTFFGYGTLMSPDSLSQDVPEYSNLRIGKLMGYRRFFGKKAGRTFTDAGKPISVLDVKEQKSSYVNGVVYDTPVEYLKGLQAREKAYDLVPLPISLDDGSAVEALVCIHKSDEDYNFINNDPTQQWYLDVCLEGAKQLGQDFYNDFINTTYVGNELLVESELKELL